MIDWPIGVLVFQTGTVHIYGADTHENAVKLYTFFTKLFQKRVHFDVKPPIVHIVGNEDRKGEWEQYAIDRYHFKCRIEEAEKMLTHEYFVGRMGQT